KGNETERTVLRSPEGDEHAALGVPRGLDGVAVEDRTLHLRAALEIDGEILLEAVADREREIGHHPAVLGDDRGHTEGVDTACRERLLGMARDFDHRRHRPARMTERAHDRADARDEDLRRELA